MGDRLPTSAVHSCSTARQIREENVRLCWKCQALLSAQYPRELVSQEVEEVAAARPHRNPDREGTLREITTSQMIEDTAAEGCSLCSLLVGCLSIAERATMREHLRSSKDQPEHPPFVTKHSLHLEEKRPSFLLMKHELRASTANETKRELNAMVQLFQDSGRFLGILRILQS